MPSFEMGNDTMSLKSHGMQAGVERVILSLLYVYAFSIFLNPGIAAVAIGALLLLTVASGNYRARYNTPLTWLSVVFLLYSALVTWSATALYPETLKFQMKGLINLNGLWFLPVVILAVAVHERERHFFNLILVSILGFLVKLTLKFDVDQFIVVVKNNEPFGFILPHNALGTYSVVAFLFVVIWFHSQGQEERLNNYHRIILLLLMLLFPTLLFLSNSRSSLLIFAAVLLAAGWGYLVRKKKPSLQRNVERRVLVFICSVILLLGILFAPRVMERFMFEADVWRAIASGQIEEMSLAGSHTYKSSDVRILMWRIAAEKIVEKPLTGWGPGTSAVLLDPVRVKTGQMLYDFHNIVIELLIEVGFVGFLLIVAANYLVLRSLWRGFRAGTCDGHLLIFLCSAIAVIYLASCINLRTNEAIGRNWMILFLALAYSFQYTRRAEQRDDRPN
jgi:O-antigen ligase